MVETVLGRLTFGRGTLTGPRFRRMVRLLVGLLLPLFATGDHHVIVLMPSGLLYGAAFDALFGFPGHAMTGGRRDFASRSQVVAARYDVVAEAEVAEDSEDAKNLLIELAWREG